jgi:mechanosensitive ion channel-like protein
MNPQAPVQEWGVAVMTSLTAAMALFLASIPRILAFVVILIIGWLITAVIAKGVAALLRSVKFNDLAARSGITAFVRRMGIDTDSSGVLAATVKWFVRLIVLVVAFDALGLPAVSQVLQQLLLWIPNVIVAMVILVVAGLAANTLASLVRGAAAQGGFSNPGLLSSVTRAAIWGFGIVAAVSQLGIASTLVNTLFIGLVGAVALAVGLSFGLGARDTAAQIVRDWYAVGQEAAPKIEAVTEIDAAEGLRREAQRRPAA